MIREALQSAFDAFKGPIEFEVRELNIAACDDVGFAHGLIHISGEMTDGEHSDSWTRATWALRKIDGTWLCSHQHLSAPFDPVTRQAVLDLMP